MESTYTTADAEAFIASARWRYAYTYRRFAPHWYVRKADSDDVAWRAFARYVYDNSRPLHWKGGTTMVCHYTDIDGYMYWCAPDEEIIVNRALVRSPDPRTPA